MSYDTIIRIKQVLENHAEIGVNPTYLKEDDDLFSSGMSSRATVSVMLGLESEFDIEFPDTMLRRDIFESIRSICNAVDSLLIKTSVE